jgi:hypothetical protein
MSHKEHYEHLMALAKELDKLAARGDYGGASYWSNSEDSTRYAVADANWKRQEGAIGMTWALQPEACKAVHAAFDQEVIDLLWRKASVILRKRAAALRGHLERQRAEIDDILAQIE